MNLYHYPETESNRASTSPADAVIVADKEGDTGDARSSFVAEGKNNDTPSTATLLWNSFVDELRRAPVAPTAEAGWDWRAAAGVLLLGVAVIGLLRIGVGVIAVKRLTACSRPVADESLRQLTDVLRAALSCKRVVELRQSPRLTTAATVGWRRPVILLPDTWPTWTPDQRRAVLAHELAHIRQADFVAQLAAQFSLALHFYHPLVHWLASRLRLEQEWTADDIAARLVGGRRAYLNTLAQLALAQPSVSVGWPAHMFLPTRGMFLRRIEMLRDSRDSGAGRGRAVGRWAAGGLLLLAALAAIGLRLPNLADTPAAEAGERVAQATGAGEGQDAANARTENHFDLTYAPENTVYVVSIRLAELSRDARWKPLAGLLNELLDENTWGRWSERIGAEQVEEASVIEYRATDGGELAIRTVLRLSADVDLEQTHAKLLPDYAETDLSGRIHMSSFTVDPLSPQQPRRSARRGFILIDKHTIVLDHAEQFKPLLAADARTEPVSATVQGQILIVGRPEQFRRVINAEAARGATEDRMKAFAPLWEETDSAQIVIRLSDEAVVEATAEAKSPAAAGKVEATAEALLTLAKNLLTELPPQEALNDADRQIVQLLFSAGKQALETARLRREGRQVTFAAETSMDMISGVLAPTLRSARDTARRAQSVNNLKQIALAMHEYHEKHGNLPPAVLYGPDGKTPYSWRVALLPYLDHQAVYDAYRFDEPWDGPNNHRLLANIPEVYRHPRDAADATDAAYFVFRGKDTAFNGREGASFREFIDGMASTLMIVESKRMVNGDATQGDAQVKGRLDVPWTNPDIDIEFAADKPVTELGLGGFFEGGFCAGFCDGSVRFLPKTIEPAKLRALITKAGKEEIPRDWLNSFR